LAQHFKINISRFKTYADMRQALDAYFFAKRDHKPESFGQSAAANSGQHPREIDYVGRGGKGDSKNGKKGKGKEGRQQEQTKRWPEVYELWQNRPRCFDLKG
jgi:hypothetical protein